MGAFICYAETNQKLKNNFEKHTRATYGLSNEKQQITDATNSWMTFKNVRLRGRRLTQKVAYCTIPLLYTTFWESKISGTEIGSVAAGNSVGG